MSKKINKLFYSSEKNNNIKGYYLLKKLFKINLLTCIIISNFASDKNYKTFNFNSKIGYYLKNNLNNNKNTENNNLIFYIDDSSSSQKFNIYLKLEDILKYNLKNNGLYEKFDIKRKKAIEKTERRNSKIVNNNVHQFKQLEKYKSENTLNTNEFIINIKNPKKDNWKFYFFKNDEDKYEIEIYGINDSKTKIKIYSLVFSPKELIKGIEEDKNNKIEHLTQKINELINSMSEENTTTINRLKGLKDSLSIEESKNAFFNDYEAIEKEIDTWYLISENNNTKNKGTFKTDKQNFNIINTNDVNDINKNEINNIRKSFRIVKTNNNKTNEQTIKTDNKNINPNKMNNGSEKINALFKMRKSSRLSNSNIQKEKILNARKRSIRQINLHKNYLDDDKHDINKDGENYNNLVKNIASLNKNIIEKSDILLKNSTKEFKEDTNTKQYKKMQNLIANKILNDSINRNKLDINLDKNNIKIEKTNELKTNIYEDNIKNNDTMEENINLHKNNFENKSINIDDNNHQKCNTENKDIPLSNIKLDPNIAKCMLSQGNKKQLEVQKIDRKRSNRGCCC